jgi:hypothetical protein
MIVRRLAVRQARIRFSALHTREVFPSELTSDEEMERNLSEWRRMNVLYEYDGLNVCTSTRKYQINKKSGTMLPKLFLRTRN